MKIKLDSGVEIETDKLGDLDAALYEKLKETVDFFKKYNISFLGMVKFGDVRIGSGYFYKDAQDFIHMIEYMSDKIHEASGGKLTLSINKAEDYF